MSDNERAALHKFLLSIRSDIPDTPLEAELAGYIDRLLAAERERCAQIADAQIPSGFTGTGKLGNSFAVARDDVARKIASLIRADGQGGE